MRFSTSNLALIIGGILAFAPALSFAQIEDQISFTHDIQPVVREFCATCHSGDDPEGDLVLETYQDVRKQVEHGKLLKRINDPKKPMPESGLMPQYLRRMFKVWAESGYVKMGPGKPKKFSRKWDFEKFKPPAISAVDIRKQGFDLLERMPGHWIGSMNLMGREFEWFAFDYRPIAPSHVHGMFEGGTIGNLFTSFFVANYKGKPAIMARNGGILNGIYRVSYFVLDYVQYGNGYAYYRLVDAYGGKDIMWMELTFAINTLEFNAYTSRFGLNSPPKRHMSFQAERMHPHLAKSAAKAVGFPKLVVEKDFSKGMPAPNWGNEGPHTSASYIWEQEKADQSLIELGKLAKDPYRIDQMPHVSQCKVTIARTPKVQGKKLLLYLSEKALTDKNGKFITQFGYIREDLLNTLLLFPELSGKQDEFNFTYLHPGKYYLTIIADMDGDGFPSPGDISCPSTFLNIRPKTHSQIQIRNLNTQN